jgi:diphosphomevalonate decarboxylase
MSIDFRNPHLVLDTSFQQQGSVSWRSPSNLALIKYWGKYGTQLPKNPSISITLDAAYTQMTLSYKRREDQDASPIKLDLLFDNQPEPAFAARMSKFLGTLTEFYPFLKQLHLSVDTWNSFPHSSGIASSASSMSALALCLCSLENHFFNTLSKESDFLQKASYIARLGSGSACRSVYPYMAAWGVHGELEGSSNEYAIPVADRVHESFRSLRNAILIVSSGSKAVSSSAGHELMDQHPYAAVRYDQARQRMSRLLPVLEAGDWETFGQIAEDEALTLHALMMASRPSYILMQPNSLALIAKIRQYRKDTGSAVCFSLDAGPNLHVLYPEKEAEAVEQFIKSECAPLCESGDWIADQAGKGPKEVQV